MKTLTILLCVLPWRLGLLGDCLQ